VPNSYGRDSLSPTQNKRRDSSDQLNSGEPKRARLSIDNDKGRGRRLFGSVLGNLGKSTIDNRSRKRMEVEAKMQEKLKLQGEVAEKESQEKREKEKLNDRIEWETQAVCFFPSRVAIQARDLLTWEKIIKQLNRTFRIKFEPLM